MYGLNVIAEITLTVGFARAQVHILASPLN